MPGMRGICSVAALSLFMVAVSNATPTINNPHTDFVSCSVSPSPDAQVSEVIQITESGDPHLAAVAAEYLKPPASFADSSAPSSGVKPLPPVPGALFMVLTGFLYISLVKDRKVWLAALAALLWAGQIGIQALPRLALRSAGNPQGPQFSTELLYPYYLDNSDRLRCDIEGTRYIALLHHLAGIPRRRSVSQVSQTGATGAEFAQLNLCAKGYQDAHRNFLPSLSAIIPKQYCLISPLKRLASRVGRFICFSPAFIFDNLPRGPPKRT